jgi:hypothetical protein
MGHNAKRRNLVIYAVDIALVGRTSIGKNTMME